MIERRSGITPISSAAGLFDAVPVAGSDRTARSCAGLSGAPPPAVATPCTASAAPVMIGEADEVPLNVVV